MASKNKYKADKLSNNPTMEDDYLFAASNTDMTGLIPNGGHNDYELENYAEIYPYLPNALPNSASAVPQPPLSECKKSVMNPKKENGQKSLRKQFSKKYEKMGVDEETSTILPFSSQKSGYKNQISSPTPICIIQFL